MRVARLIRVTSESPGHGVRIFFPLLICVLPLIGCNRSFTERARNGVTFYCPGAGNIDFGDAGIREGLTAAGYNGEVATITWTVSFNPAIDQALRLNARLAAGRLADEIEACLRKYPNAEVNLVGLSAGSGVAVWALEELKPQHKVNNVVLLASSLSHDYDVSKALARVKGNIYNYYSPHDVILAGPMKVFGTIDLKFGTDGAGAVGLHPPKGGDRVVNIPWKRSYEKLGYYGGHMDSTNPRFVREVLARHLITSEAGVPLSRTVASAGPDSDPQN